MKKIIFLLLLFVFIFNSCEIKRKRIINNEIEKKVRVKSVIGNSFVIRQGRVKPIKIKQRMILKSSDIIRTYKNSNVKILLNDNRGIIIISENSYIGLKNLIITDTQIDVNEGKIKLALSKMTGRKRFSLQTPTAVAGVRGTTFMIEVKSKKTHAFPYSVQLENNESNSSTIEVFTGSVAVINPENYNEEIVLTKFQKLTITEGIKFKDIHIEKIDLTTVNDFKEITEVEEIKQMKMLDEIKYIKKAEAGELESIINETVNAPKLKSKTYNNELEDIIIYEIIEKPKGYIIKPKGRIKVNDNKRAKQLKVNDFDIEF